MPEVANRELRMRADVEACSIAVVQRRRWMRLNIYLQIKLGHTPEGLAENLRLQPQLLLVAGVLVMTAAAASEVRTWWFGPQF